MAENVYIQEDAIHLADSEDESVDVEHDDHQQTQTENIIVDIPVEQIPPTLQFHPGCKVLHYTNMNLDGRSGEDPVVLLGAILNAGVNLSDVSREFMYRFRSDASIDDSETFYAQGSNLHFAQGTPVWAKISDEYERATVVSSHRVPLGQKAVYSVVELKSRRLRSGLETSYVCYRGPRSIRPTLDGSKSKRKGDHHHSEAIHDGILDNNCMHQSAAGEAGDPQLRVPDCPQSHIADSSICRNSQRNGETEYEEKKRGEGKRCRDISSDLIKHNPDGSEQPESIGKTPSDELGYPQSKRPKLVSSEDLVERTIAIPKCAHYAGVQDAVRNSLTHQARSWNAEIGYTHVNGIMKVIVDGRRESVQQLVHIITNTVIECSEKGDRDRVIHSLLYDEQSQQHSTTTSSKSSEGCAFVKPPLFSRDAWMAIQDFPLMKPKVLGQILGRFPGVKRSEVAPIELRSNCEIKIFGHNARWPYILMLGSNISDLSICRSLVMDRFALLERDILLKTSKGLRKAKSGNAGFASRLEQFQLGFNGKV